MKPRPSCPFYGFSKGYEAFICTRGNQCALSINCYASCHMETQGEEPDWRTCGFKDEINPKFLEALNNFFIVFPQEYPKGITFGEWMKIIMPQSEE